MSKDTFDALVAKINDLAAEALSLDDSKLERLSEVRDLAERARGEADGAVNEIYHTLGSEAGRACVSILKKEVQISLMLIRARHRWALDPDGERRRSDQRTREAAYQDLASTDQVVRDRAREVLKQMRGESR